MLIVFFTVLTEREDGALYAKETFTDLWEPRQISNWYRLTMTEDTLASCTDDINKKLGHPLTPLTHPPTVWQDAQGWKYHITSGISGQREPAYTEIIPVPEPTQTGRKYPLEWYNGAWRRKPKQA